MVFLCHEQSSENSCNGGRLVKLHSRLRINTGSSPCMVQGLCGCTLSLLAAPGAGQVCRPLFTLERIWVWRKERKEREALVRAGGGKEGTDTSLITSFLSIVFCYTVVFFMNRNCQNNSRQKRKCTIEAQVPLKTCCITLTCMKL